MLIMTAWADGIAGATEWDSGRVSQPPGTPHLQPPSPHPTPSMIQWRCPVHYPNSKHWFTTSILWRKVPESGARSVFSHDHENNSRSLAKSNGPGCYGRKICKITNSLGSFTVCRRRSQKPVLSRLCSPPRLSTPSHWVLDVFPRRCHLVNSPTWGVPVSDWRSVTALSRPLKEDRQSSWSFRRCQPIICYHWVINTCWVWALLFWCDSWIISKDNSNDWFL